MITMQLIKFKYIANICHIYDDLKLIFQSFHASLKPSSSWSINLTE